MDGAKPTKLLDPFSAGTPVFSGDPLDARFDAAGLSSLLATTIKAAQWRLLLAPLDAHIGTALFAAGRRHSALAVGGAGKVMMLADKDGFRWMTAAERWYLVPRSGNRAAPPVSAVPSTEVGAVSENC
jgi:hypothetical protein